MQNKDVLVIEDDESTSKLLKAILEKEGYSVHAAFDGNQAAQLINEMMPPLLVLLDIMLPFKSGRELLKQIREKDDWKSVPVMMLSALSDEEEIVKALENGANDYLVKPFGPAELIARINRLKK